MELQELEQVKNAFYNKSDQPDFFMKPLILKDLICSGSVDASYHLFDGVEDEAIKVAKNLSAKSHTVVKLADL